MDVMDEYAARHPGLRLQALGWHDDGRPKTIDDFKASTAAVRKLLEEDEDEGEEEELEEMRMKLLEEMEEDELHPPPSTRRTFNWISRKYRSIRRLSQ